MDVLDDFRFFHLGRSGVQEPGLGEMGLGHLEHGGIHQGIDLQAVGIPGGEGIAYNGVVQRRRRAVSLTSVREWGRILVQPAAKIAPDDFLHKIPPFSYICIDSMIHFNHRKNTKVL